jgi:PKD repeat protein
MEVFMKRCVWLLVLTILSVSLSATDPVGQWTFDNPNNLLEATIGNDLVLTGTHTATTGTDTGDGAVNIGVGSYYQCFHDIAANGGGSWVNQFTLVFDFKVSSIGDWYCFHQTNPANTNDGDAFISPNGRIGVAATGYSEYIIEPDEWYRLVIASDLGNSYKYYLDGALLVNGGTQSLDGRFSLSPSSSDNEVLLFADENAEDNPIDISAVSIYDVCLNATEVTALGGFGHEFVSPGLLQMYPYLQGPTPTSMYVCWHESGSDESTVEYGTTEALGSTATGSIHTFNAETVWHKVKLENLLPDTEYYYKCISGNEESNVFTFRTSPSVGDRNGHFVFAVIGDNQANPTMVTELINSMRDKFIELYGDDWYNYVDLLLNVGDTVTTGTEGEKYYEFELGPVKFISLNSITAGDTQLNWLQSVVTATDSDPDFDWLFTFKHHPGHSEIWPDGNSSWVWDQVNPIINQSPKSAMAFAGHSHNYQRGALNEGTTRTVISGASGAALDRWGMYNNQTDYPDVTKSLDHYVYVIVEIDLENRSYEAKTFSLGHDDLRLDNVLVDSWHRNLNQPDPETPSILNVGQTAGSPLLITASPFTSSDEIMSSWIQLTDINSGFNNPLIDELRNRENVYGDSGSPDYLPIDQNAGIDLQRLYIQNPNLTAGEDYLIRVKYRDRNLMWSEWSEVYTYEYQIANPAAMFALDRTQIEEGEQIRFTDISVGNVSGWEWDINADGQIDSFEQDPVIIFTQAGVYGLRLTVTIDGFEYSELQENIITVNPVVASEDEVASPPLASVSTYPNPFYQENMNRDILIDVTMSKALSSPRLEVFNVRGQKIISIEINPQSLKQQITWDRTDFTGRKVSTGIYFTTLSAQGKVITSSRILIIK